MNPIIPLCLDSIIFFVGEEPDAHPIAVIAPSHEKPASHTLLPLVLPLRHDPQRCGFGTNSCSVLGEIAEETIEEKQWGTP